MREGLRRLADCGDDPDARGQGGVWASRHDREVWGQLTGGAKTVGAAALGLYLLGDRALHLVGGLVQEAQFAAEKWDDQCYISGDGGTLVCCESCPRTVAPASMGWRCPPREDFFCTYCRRDLARRARRSRGAAAKGGGGGGGGSGGDKRGKKGDKTEKLELRAWSDKVEKLRRNVERHGLYNGSICEVQPDEAGERAGDRCFVKVLDGSVLPSPAGPSIAVCRFFSAWNPARPRRMKLLATKGPVAVSRIMSAGKVEEILDGSNAAGYRPQDVLP